MVQTTYLSSLVVAALLSSVASAESMYSKSSPVLQLNSAKDYEKLVANSKHATIVEFYAPWCGHCKNLKPAYEKAAKNLAGLAQVAAMDCDEEANKPFCGSMGVQGFPTLKIVKPSTKPGKPVVSDYQGARTAKAIVEAVVDKIPNHVKRVADNELETFLKENDDTPKAILFTEKGTTSALLRSLAIDFLGTVSFAQIRKTQKEAAKRFEVSSYPTFILLPGGDKEPVVYDGELKKDSMVEFLAQVAAPNSNPTAPAKAKKSVKNDKKESQSDKASATEITLEDEAIPTEATNQDTLDELNNEKPVGMDSGPPMLLMLEHAPALENKCMQDKSQPCLLILLPKKDDPDALLDERSQTALASLGEISHKHAARTLFPFYTVPATNEKGTELRKAIGLDKDEKRVEVVVINAKRNWYRRYPGEDVTTLAIEEWVDQIRMGEGKKEKLPSGVIVDASTKSESADSPTEEPPVVEEKVVVDETVQEKETGHNEL